MDSRQNKGCSTFCTNTVGNHEATIQSFQRKFAAKAHAKTEWMDTSERNRLTKIHILCTGNSCRSQMGEAFLRWFDADLEVYSAGTAPSSSVHPLAIRVMDEIGIDLNDAIPKDVKRYLDQPFDYVITVCDHARETCPVFTSDVKHQLHIGFEDPAEATGTEEKKLAVFRRVRDEIREEFGKFYLGLN